jgi:dTDP-4-dehydrorhamnose 3,5-epimerase
MDVIETRLPGVMRVKPKRFGDARGWFSETFRVDALARAGIDCAFAQDDQSFSALKGTIRGLHFQDAPQPQAKLVRVLSGAILDVAVDLRRRTIQNRQGLQMACLEEIAFEQGFIGRDQLVARGEVFKKTAYGQNLLRLARDHIN